MKIFNFLILVFLFFNTNVYADLFGDEQESSQNETSSCESDQNLQVSQSFEKLNSEVKDINSNFFYLDAEPNATTPVQKPEIVSNKKVYDIHSFSDIPHSHQNLINAFKSTVRIKPTFVSSNIEDVKRRAQMYPGQKLQATEATRNAPGSGVIVSANGLVATAAHVVADDFAKTLNDGTPLKPLRKSYIVQVPKEDGSFEDFEAIVLGINQQTDTAVMQIRPRAGQRSNFAFSPVSLDGTDIGNDQNFSLGYSEGKHMKLKRHKIEDVTQPLQIEEHHINTNVIMALNESAYDTRGNNNGLNNLIYKYEQSQGPSKEVISDQITEEISKYDSDAFSKVVGGDSGGPLFNSKGEVIGICSAGGAFKDQFNVMSETREGNRVIQSRKVGTGFKVKGESLFTPAKNLVGLDKPRVAQQDRYRQSTGW